MQPPGKNSGRTTKESVENANRPLRGASTAESPISARAASPKPGRNRYSISSPDIAPPLPWPMTIVGESRNGTGQVQESMSIVAGGGRSGSGMAGGSQFQAPVEVVRSAGTFGGHHGGSQRIARRALLAERVALVRLDQPLKHLSGAAER